MNPTYHGSRYSIEELRQLASEAVKHGRWMIRADNNGVSASPRANGFVWQPPGEWTRAPDFDGKKKCGGGLHGQDSQWGGYCEGTRIVFCEHRGGYIGGIDGNKMKVEEARILLVGELPDGLQMEGALDLSHCTLPEGLKLPDSVGDWLDLSNCTLPEGLKLPDSVGGWLDLNHCTLPEGLKLPDSVGGWLDLSYCTLPEGLKLPDSVGDALNLSHCTLPKGLKLDRYRVVR